VVPEPQAVAARYAGVPIQDTVTGTRRVRLELALAEQDPYPGEAKLLNTAPERPVVGQPFIDERQHHDPHALFELTFAAGLDKARFPALAEAGQALFTELSAPAHALCGNDHQARRLVLAIAACANGHAVFLTEGVLNDLPDPLSEARREAATAASALIATYVA
jgi:hypothetical protein